MRLEDAEKHRLSDFVRTEPGLPSQLIVDRRQLDREIFSCPACGCDTNMPAHGSQSGCGGCGLRWIAYGNIIHIWRA